MACRDCRLGLLEKLANAWETGAATVSVVDAYTAEATNLSNKIQEAHEVIQKTAHDAVQCAIDVPISFIGCGGQIEVTENQLLPNLQKAVLVNRNRIQVLNDAVHQQAAKVLERLENCSQLRSKQQGAGWELSRIDLATEHKAEHVKQLQLFHVTRRVQDLLECNRSGSCKTASEGKILERLRDLNQRLQVDPHNE